MRILVARTPEEKATGLLRFDSLPPDTIMIFEDMQEGDVFHMRGMKFGIGIAAYDEKGNLLKAANLEPGDDVFVAPERTKWVVEGCPDFWKKEVSDELGLA